MKNCDIIFFVFSMMSAPELFASPPESFNRISGATRTMVRSKVERLKHEVYDAS